MAELSIQRKRRNTQTIVQRVADNIKAANDDKKNKRKIGESQLAKEGVVADVVRQQLLGKTTNNKNVVLDGSKENAIAGQLVNSPAQLEKNKFENQTLSAQKNPYLTQNQKNVLDGIKPAKDNKKETGEEIKNEARQNYIRDMARNKAGLNLNDSDTPELVSEENKLKQQVDIIVDGLSKYGKITWDDAIKIIQSKIEFRPTFMYTIILWIWDFFLLIGGIISGLFAFTGIGVVITFIFGIIIWISNVIFNIICFFWERKALSNNLSGIDKIKSLRSIILKKTSATRYITTIVEALPFINIFPWKHFGKWRNQKFIKKLEKDLKRVQKEAQNLN